MRYFTGISKANKALDRALAAKVQTGSAIAVNTAQYKAFQRNDMRYWKIRYTETLAAAPKVTGYPRWFLVAATDKGAEPATRDLLVFVQQQKGAAWRVAYAPFSRTAAGPLSPGVDVADFPDLVPADDARLAAPPGKVAAVVADVITRGSKSVFTARVENGRFVSSSRASLLDNRDAFTGNGWSGSSKAVAARTPVYAVRTKSGGALVWFAIDSRHTYRQTGRSTGMTWQTDQYGDLHHAFGLPSTIKQRMDRLERNEVVAYVPPKGKGRIRVIGNRWFPLSVSGR